METKRQPNWSSEENLLLTEEIHQRTHIMKGKLSTTLTRVDKKDAWKEIANKINASFALVGCTLWNTKKRGLTFCQKGVRRLQLTRRPLLLLVSFKMTLF